MSRNKKYKKENKEKPAERPVESKAPGEAGKWYSQVIHIIVISILFLLVYNYIFDEKLDLNGDNAYYYVLGKAISMGEGYVNIASINKTPNNHFPPGYPFILGVFMHISDSTTFLKILNGIILLFSLILLYQLFKRISEHSGFAFVTVFFLTLNSHLLQYGTMLMSEVSFILFSYLCLLLVDKAELKGDFLKKPDFYLILLTLTASYYIRSTGLALFGGIILFLLIRRNWKSAVALSAGFILLALPWFIRGQKLGGNSYIEPLVMVNPYRPELGNADLSGYVVRFFSNLSRYITREIPNVSFPFIDVNYTAGISAGEWLTGLLILALSVYGFYRIWRRSLLFICYLAGTFGILLMWPEVWRGVRFVLPVMPLIVFSMVTGVYFLISRILSPVKIRFNILLLLVFSLAFIKPIKLLHTKAVNPYPSSWQNYFRIAEWFKTENLEDEVVICRKPILFHLKSGTYTAPYAYTKETADMLADLRRKQADYVVLDNLGYRQTYEYLYPVVRANPEHFPLVFSLTNPDTYLLKFNDEN